MADAKITISAEEAQRIMSLPERVFAIGGKETRGLFDEAEGRFYLLTPSGELSGKSALVKKMPPPEPEEQEPPSEPQPGEDEDGDDEAGDGAAPVDKTKMKKLTFAIISALVIAAVGLFVIVPMFGGGDNAPASPTTSPSETTVPSTTEPVTTAPAAEKVEETTVAAVEVIEVVQVIADMIPGDVINENNIQSAAISHETYNQISVISDIYKWEESADLINKYVNTYIPAGRYLSLDTVSSVYTIPNNPWINEQPGMVYVVIPVDAETLAGAQYNYGTMFDMSITKKTVNETPNSSSESEPPPVVEGLEHQTSIQQSVVIDSYQISNLIVCDMLNSEGQSVYGRYVSFMGIPVGKQPTYIQQALLRDDGLADALTPTAIKVKMTNEQSVALGDLRADNLTITFSVKPEIDATNENKSEFAAEARAMTQTIQKAMEAIAESAKEE